MALVIFLNNTNRIAAPANQQNLLRAGYLCERLRQSQLLAQVLIFQFFVHWTVKDFDVARKCSEQLRLSRRVLLTRLPVSSPGPLLEFSATQAATTVLRAIIWNER
jgi:hypothetical protein